MWVGRKIKGGEVGRKVLKKKALSVEVECTIHRVEPKFAHGGCVSAGAK